MKEYNKPFYIRLGAVVKRERIASGLTVGDLSMLSGEQNKTIRHIEDGKPFSMHHMTWMREELGIKFDNLKYTESNNGEEIKTLTDLI